MGRVKGSGKYVYRDGDGKHSLSLRTCAHCGVEYLGRVDSNSRFCSQRCSGKATGFKGRPVATQDGYLVCTKCGKEKPEDAFARHSQSESGRKPRCRACQAEKWLATRTPEDLARLRENGKRLWSTDTERMRAQARVNVARWRAANPEAARAIGSRRRARKYGTAIGPLTAIALAGKWSHWAGRCWMCGGEATQWDHVKPLGKGGAHILANLRPACAPCNHSKNDRWPFKP